MTCPHCGESARFVEYRPKTFLSVLGPLELDRAYYHCACCRQGHFPWDHLLRLSPQQLTPAAQELTALAGISDSFGAAAKRTLVKMSGIHLCESTVQRTTEASGAQLGERLEQGEVFGPREDWEWHSDAHGRPCAYVSVDATGILMQGEEPGSAADGRMVYVGMVFNPQPREATDQETLAMPCQGVRYLAGLYTLEELGLQLRRQAAQVGMDGVEQWIALTTVTDALGAVTTTAYDPVGNVLSVTDPDGNKTTMSGSSAAEYLASGVLIPRLLGSGG